MKYLLDTCVISEFTKVAPDINVIDWLDSVSEDNLFISVLTIGELQRGVFRLPVSRKKNELTNWLSTELVERFKGRIVDVDFLVAKKWGIVQARVEQKGRVMPVIDSLIAATGLTHNFAIVTRNTSDMIMSGVALINPWVKE